MIIETQYNTNDPVTVKTQAGEEIVGRFVEEDDKTITLQKPMAIMATQQGIGLGPLAFTISQDAKVRLNKSAVLFVHKTEADMAKQYMSSSTGIQMA